MGSWILKDLYKYLFFFYSNVTLLNLEKDGNERDRAGRDLKEEFESRDVFTTHSLTETPANLIRGTTWLGIFPTTGKKVRERNCRLENVAVPYSRLKLPFTLELSAKRCKAASVKKMEQNLPNITRYMLRILRIVCAFKFLTNVHKRAESKRYSRENGFGRNIKRRVPTGVLSGPEETVTTPKLPSFRRAMSTKVQVKTEVNTYLPGVGVQSEVRHIVVSVLRGCESVVDPQNSSPVGTSSIYPVSFPVQKLRTTKENCTLDFYRNKSDMRIKLNHTVNVRLDHKSGTTQTFRSSSERATINFFINIPRVRTTSSLPMQSKIMTLEISQAKTKQRIIPPQNHPEKNSESIRLEIVSHVTLEEDKQSPSDLCFCREKSNLKERSNNENFSRIRIFVSSLADSLQDNPNSWKQTRSSNDLDVSCSDGTTSENRENL
ncbi:hypothetical protein WN51_14028 [Melipona quadrifasciata]|uniref:Uncharacterized protein n=1 Tax=Melipona quadrifasciata TaxID=166423 RepID=A0A0M8ZYX8_9HYME|nr:hypothetical protein WN51_14028 [Melipona quadrifasciata]